MIKCAIFDLDGTLVNTIDDLGNATDYVLEKYGKDKKWTISDYRMFVGDGAKKLIERAFEHTLSPDELENAYEMFKIKYQEILLDNAHIYDGVKEQLDILKQKGVKIAVVTNKPHLSAIKMIETLFGKGYFDLITGAKDDMPRKPDPTTTKATLKVLNCKANEAIFFGDSDVDVKTAKNAGIEAIACSWGYRSFESFLKDVQQKVLRAIHEDTDVLLEYTIDLRTYTGKILFSEWRYHQLMYGDCNHKKATFFKCAITSDDPAKIWNLQYEMYVAMLMAEGFYLYGENTK